MTNLITCDGPGKAEKQRLLNAAILKAIRDTEDALETIISYHRRMSAYYSGQSDDYYYRWRDAD